MGRDAARIASLTPIGNMPRGDTRKGHIMKREDKASVKIHLSGTELMQAIRNYVQVDHPDIPIIGTYVNINSWSDDKSMRLGVDDKIEVSWESRKE